MLDAIFPYQWFLDEKEYDYTSVRVYGLDNDNNSVCLRINDYLPYAYVELPVLPNNNQWDGTTAQRVIDAIDELIEGEEEWKKKRNKQKKPVARSLQKKHKLYYLHLDKDGKRKKFPFLKLTFSHPSHIKNLYWILTKEVDVPLMGKMKLKVHESDASPVLQIISNLDLPIAGWIAFDGSLVRNKREITLCDKEYVVRWKAMQRFTPDLASVMKTNITKSLRGINPNPLVMAFDIEAYSSNPSRMPDSKKATDKIFQISCVLGVEGCPESEYRKCLLTLGDVDQETLGDDIVARCYMTEEDLLLGFTSLVRAENPQLVIGFNIFGFDFMYMLARAKDQCMCLSEFNLIGCHKKAHAEDKMIKWSSSAYKDQEFYFLDAEGRLFVDLLPLIKRDYKFNNYKLNTIAKEILKDSKKDLSPQGIFQSYEVGMQKDSAGVFTTKARKAISICGSYCVQDSVLLLKLMDKMKLWVSLTEQATTFNSSIFSIFTAGQQIKVYSQVYKYCLENDIVVEKDGYITKQGERYTGAHVFDPVVGMHKNVVSLDFSSLYPSTIIGYNIDYSTLVNDDSIQDSDCNIMQYEDHLACEHDPKVIKRRELTQYIDKEEAEIRKLRDKRDSLKLKDNRALKEKISEEVKKRDTALKAVRAARSDITKTITKNTICGVRNYRYYKNIDGVLPTILKGLLQARKNTKKQIKDVKCSEEVCKDVATHGNPSTGKAQFCILHKEDGHTEIIKDNHTIKDLRVLLDVLDKRQLSYKVASNSAYGAMGVVRGYLPFMPGAMCTTFKGRENICTVADTLTTKYGARLIYGDTDSNYITFPDIKTTEELWDQSKKCSREISTLFPQAISLEFEDAIYKKYLIFSKKRYAYSVCDKHGVLQRTKDGKVKIGKKGILIARRDNPAFVRTLYEEILQLIMEEEDAILSDVLYFIVQKLNTMFAHSVDYEGFVITQSVGNVNDMKLGVDEKGRPCIGSYAVTLLSKDPEVKQQSIEAKKAVDEADYYEKCLPAVVQLAQRMRRRGQRVDTGSRLEYIIEDNGVPNDKKYNKVESYDYLKNHGGVLKVDYLWYLDYMITPIDEVLNVWVGKSLDFCKKQYKIRAVYSKVIKEINTLFKPKTRFIETGTLDSYFR